MTSSKKKYGCSGGIFCLRAKIFYLTPKVSIYAKKLQDSRKCRPQPFEPRLIYNSLFDSRLRYGSLGWGTASNNNLNRLRVLQNKALRFISFADFRSPSSPIYVNLNVLRLDDLFSVQKAIFMYNLHYTNLPRALHNYALPPSHRYPTSYANNLNYVTPSVRTNRGKSSIKFSGPQTWASIPTNIKECGSRKLFTRSCKDHYMKILSIACKDKKIIPIEKQKNP